ncbi:MAG: enhanced serine sensitivity protein SseB [Lachnospiraceae bacterium]|nr:enhanced serine sensitivity protein SseB [Lachnospiraceae bacterium]
MGVDVNKPVENPRLKELLKQRASAPQSEQLPILNEIAEEMAMNAAFLAVVDFGDSHVENNPDGTAVFKEDTQISFPMLGLNDGGHVQPLFTDWEELRKWDPFKVGDVKTFILSFDDVYALMSSRKAGIVVNPFGDAFMIPFETLDHIKHVKDSQKSSAKVQQQVVQKDTKVMIGEPREYPKHMVEAISAHARKVPAINAIWLKLMIKEGEQSFLLIVDAGGDARSYFQGIADAAIPYLPKGMYIDMVPANEGFGKSAATGVPFFKR